MWDKLKHLISPEHHHRHDKPALFQREPWRFRYLVAALACGAMVWIAIQGELGYYIHPRYHAFTVFMVAVAALLLAIAAAQYTYKKQTNIEFASVPQLVWLFTRWLTGKGTWIAVIAMLLLITVPAVPLMSAAAARKGSSVAQLEYVKDMPWYAEPQGVYQLSAVLSTSEGTQRNLGETHTISGFVREDGERDMFRVSRFVIACCAVDATPRDIIVHAPGWQEYYPVDSWVEVTGTVDIIARGAGQHEVFLRPERIEPIDQPDDPYEYL